MKKESKKLSSVVMAGIVAASAVVGAVGWDIMDAPEVIVKEVPVEVAGETVIEYVDVPVNVEVIKEVEVIKTVTDTELIQATCDRLLFDDLSECQTEVKAEDEALKLALEYVESADFFDEIEDANIVDDEDDINVIRVYEDFEDINITRSNFDDDKYRFEIEVKIEDTEEEEKFRVIADILVEDGEVELKSVSKK